MFISEARDSWATLSRWNKAASRSARSLVPSKMATTPQVIGPHMGDEHCIIDADVRWSAPEKSDRSELEFSRFALGPENEERR